MTNCTYYYPEAAELWCQVTHLDVDAPPPPPDEVFFDFRDGVWQRQGPRQTVWMLRKDEMEPRVVAS